MKISKIYKKIRDNFVYQYFLFKNGKNFRIDALIIGGQRCASTSMINFLSESNNVVTPKNNEQLYFFSDFYDKTNNYKKYHIKFLSNFLKKKENKKIFIEKTPEYCLDEEYLNRIKEYNSNIKIIFIFREPYSRIKSAYELYKKLGYAGDFEKFINHDEKKYNVLKFSKYKEIYNNIFSKFELKNVLLLNFDEINSEFTKKKLSKFLNVESNSRSFKKTNSYKTDENLNKYKDAITSVYGSKLDDDYREFLNLFKKYEDQFRKFYKF